MNGTRSYTPRPLRFTRESQLSQLKALVEKLGGRTPLRRELREAGICPGNLQRLFGSARKAFAEAGAQLMPLRKAAPSLNERMPWPSDYFRDPSRRLTWEETMERKGAGRETQGVIRIASRAKQNASTSW
jgi:hypothetical protein